MVARGKKRITNPLGIYYVREHVSQLIDVCVCVCDKTPVMLFPSYKIKSNIASRAFKGAESGPGRATIIVEEALES